jgi:hypothetical protein
MTLVRPRLRKASTEACVDGDTMYGVDEVSTSGWAGNNQVMARWYAGGDG